MTAQAELDAIYNQILTTARGQADILGLILNGSRGKGLITPYSDYDCSLVVVDEAALARYEARYADLPPGIDLCLYTLDSLRRHAAWGGETAWDRYDWAHLTPPLDKTGGQLTHIVAEKGRIPPEEVPPFLAKQLDTYINHVFRSLKSLRVGDPLGYRLEAAESIPVLLNILFALHNGRLRPYHKYLAWELQTYPLTDLPWPPQTLLALLTSILSSGAYQDQQTLLQAVERLARAAGHGPVFEAWEGKDRWAMTFRPAAS